MENEIKVYKMNDYEWWASKWSKEETNEWYKKQMGLSEEENPLDDIEECDLDSDGVWMATDNPEDIAKLGNSDEITGYSIVEGKHRSKTQFGNLKRVGYDVYKYTSYREAIKQDITFTEPYCIGCTEW